LAPALLRLPTGCAFHPRCAHVMDICKAQRPEPTMLPGGRTVECYLYSEKA
jgi:peptide/nickel transport system ATP-binding protein